MGMIVSSIKSFLDTQTDYRRSSSVTKDFVIAKENDSVCFLVRFFLSFVNGFFSSSSQHNGCGSNWIKAYGHRMFSCTLYIESLI